MRGKKCSKDKNLSKEQWTENLLDRKQYQKTVEKDALIKHLFTSKYTSERFLQ